MSSNKYIAMIPARLGSQRLKKKNLALLEGVPLISRAVEKCFEARCFSEVWVNTESEEIAKVASKAGAKIHMRPATLADNVATSEQFVAEFLHKHDCTAIFQVHSIAPLLSSIEVSEFVKYFDIKMPDVLLSCIHDQIEVAYQNQPVNFTFNEKTNSQDLSPVQRITWSITGWKRESFLKKIQNNETATYNGTVDFYPVSQMSGHVIKTQEDLDIAAIFLNK